MYVECNKQIYEVISDYSQNGTDYYFLSNSAGPITAKRSDCTSIMLLKDLCPGTKLKFTQNPSVFILCDISNLPLSSKMPCVVMELSNGLLHELSGEQPVHPA